MLECYGFVLVVIHSLDGILRDPRTGYALFATTRHELITVLFQRFPQRDKILTGHAVTNVELLPQGVSVNCANGSSFQGDIVVGADGIHSTIRAEMWKHASAAAPDAFSVKDKGMSFPYTNFYTDL